MKPFDPSGARKRASHCTWLVPLSDIFDICVCIVCPLFLFCRMHTLLARSILVAACLQSLSERYRKCMLSATAVKRRIYRVIQYRYAIIIETRRYNTDRAIHATCLLFGYTLKELFQSTGQHLRKGLNIPYNHIVLEWEGIQIARHRQLHTPVDVLVGNLVHGQN